MYENTSEQVSAVLKPFNDLVAFNSKIMREAAEKQKDFYTDLLNEGIAFSRELSSQKDFSGVYQAQKSYLETIQEKMLNASTDAYEFMTSAQERAGNIVKGSAAR